MAVELKSKISNRCDFLEVVSCPCRSITVIRSWVISVIYWIMILTYKYRFVVLLCIRSFVTYSWLCNMNVRSWIEMGIYMDKYICDNVLGCEVSTRVHVWPYEMCAMADVIPGGTSVSWQTQSSCSACGPYVRFWWIRRLGKCTGMPLIL